MRGAGIGKPWGGLGLVLFVLLLGAPILGALARIGLLGLPEAMARTLADRATWRALGFSLSQAAASLALAAALGIPGAWMVSRYDFPGRRALRALAVVPFSIPPVLVVLAFVLYLGRNGYLNRFLMGTFGLDAPPFGFLYSFWGIVLVHGFYNFPIILESLASAWDGLPLEREEAARSLGAGQVRAFLTGSLPYLVPALAEGSALVFLFCYFSFVIPLIFGPLGGATLEVEIYRAARLEGLGEKAAALALLETAIALVIAYALARLGRLSRARGSSHPGFRAAMKPRGSSRIGIGFYILLIAVFFAGPIASLGIEAFRPRQRILQESGLGNFFHLLSGGADSLLGRALWDSATTALPAAMIALAGAALLAYSLKGSVASLKKVLDLMVNLPLAVSGVVSALGWSLLFPRSDRLLLILIQASAALPFTFKAFSAALSSMDPKSHEAARLLGATRLRAFLEIEVPVLMPAALSAFAFAFALAMGDATTPLILGLPDFQSLPLLVYRLVGAYRFPEACAAGLVLALFVGLVFFMKERRIFHA